MPAGGCDPATRGEKYNVTELELEQGAVVVHARWDWDGVSTIYTGCDGPILRLRLSNTTDVPWFLHTTGRRGQPRDIRIRPGDNRIFNAAQASSIGFDSRSDLAGMILDTNPTQ